MISGTYQNAPTTNPEVVANGRLISPYLCTQVKPVTTNNRNKNVTLAINSQDAPELNCVLKDGQGDMFSVRSIVRKIAWPPTKLGTIQWRFQFGRNPNAPPCED